MSKKGFFVSYPDLSAKEFSAIANFLVENQHGVFFSADGFTFYPQTSDERTIDFVGYFMSFTRDARLFRKVYDVCEKDGRLSLDNKLNLVISIFPGRNVRTTPQAFLHRRLESLSVETDEIRRYVNPDNWRFTYAGFQKNPALFRRYRHIFTRYNGVEGVHFENLEEEEFKSSVRV